MWFIQGSTLLGIIALPIWLGTRFHASESSNREPDGQGGLFAAWSPEASTEGIISSLVLPLHLSESQLNSTDPMSVTVVAKQLRFTSKELRILRPPLGRFKFRDGRAPAGKSRKPSLIAWNISQIERLPRQEAGAPESVLLIRSEDAVLTAETASVYVELDDGINDFLLTYRSSSGSVKKIKLKVKLKNRS